MYKTTTETAPGERIIFREITGSSVDIYINGEQAASAPSDYGKRFEYVSENGGTLDITVVIKSGSTDRGAGISKPVVAAMM